MLLIPDPNTAVIDPFREHPTLNINCFVQDPVTGESYIARPALHREEGRGLPEGHRHRRHRVLRSRSRVLHLRLRCASTRTSTRATTSSTRSRACGTRVASSSSTARRTSATSRGTRRGTSPSRRWTSTRTSARRWSLMLEQVGIEIEVQHHEVGTAGQAEIDMRFDTLAAHGRQAHALQVRGQERRVRRAASRSRSCRSRSSGQRLGHARAPVAVEGRRAAVLRREGLRRAVRPRALVHRRPAQARAGDPRVLEPDDELVQAARAGLRGAGEPRVLAAQPLGGGAHPAVLEEPEGEAARVPLPRPVVQPVPRVLGDARWPGSTASRTGSSRPTPVDRDLYDLPPEELAQVPQVPGSLDEALDALEADHEFLLAGGVFTPDVIETWVDVQAGERDRRGAAPPAPVGVLHVLRHLDEGGRPPSSAPPSAADLRGGVLKAGEAGLRRSDDALQTSSEEVECRASARPRRCHRTG